MTHPPNVNRKKSTIGRLTPLRIANRVLSAASPPLATRWAARLFCTPRRAPHPEREQEWARGAHRFAIDTAEGRLAAWSWGTGERTVLLVHGWSGRGLQLAALAHPLVQRGYRVVAYDCPAHGASPGQRTSLVAVTRALADVTAVVEPSAGVVAHSLGSAAVLWAAPRHQVRFPRAALIAPAVDLDAMTGGFAAATGFSAGVMGRMQALFESQLRFRWDEVEPRRLGKGFDAPLLVVHDRDDREVSWTEGQAIAEAAPQAELVTTHRLGHRRILRDPQVVERVTAFLESRDTALSPPPSMRQFAP